MRAAAAAFAVARDTPRIAFAPSLDLVGVPSSLIIARSIPTWSVASWPISSGAIADLTLATAFWTPLPPYRFLSPSRSSRASCSPVLAPEGTAARPKAPPASFTSTSMVGLPRESMISRAVTAEMVVFMENGRKKEARGNSKGRAARQGKAKIPKKGRRNCRSAHFRARGPGRRFKMALWPRRSAAGGGARPRPAWASPPPGSASHSRGRPPSAGRSAPRSFGRPRPRR